MIRVAVLLGGISNEREISLKSGKQIIKNLNHKRYKITSYDPKTQLMKLIRDAKAKRIDVAFNALHGKGGEDGGIQGLLDWLGVPYTGSGVMASALAIDKNRSKMIYRENDIPTPTAIMLEKFELALIKRKLGDKIVIKPSADGSSVGVSVNPPKKHWKKLIETRIRKEGSCLVESFCPGRELTVGVLGDQPLPVIEIRPRNEFFDFEAKYTPGMSEEICPAPIPNKIAKQAQEIGLKAHKALDCRGYSRTDMIWTSKGLEVLETNTLPGMTETSLLPLAAKTAGYSFSALLDQMIRLAMK